MMCQYAFQKITTSLILFLQKARREKKGGAIKRPVEEAAFDAFNEKDLPDFLKEVCVEMFVYSNFCHFNGDDHRIVTSEVDVNDQEKLVVKIKVQVSQVNKT